MLEFKNETEKRDWKDCFIAYMVEKDDPADCAHMADEMILRMRDRTEKVSEESPTEGYGSCLECFPGR